MSAISALSSSHPSKIKSRALPEGSVYCYAIQAVAEPGVMPRVLELFAKRGLIPLRWHADRLGTDGSELSIDVQVTGLEQHSCDYIARCLRQIYGVETVLTSEKTAA